MVAFIGRNKILQDLMHYKTKKSSSLIVITGRRRVGKSRLISEFSKGYPNLKFSGLPPSDKTNAQDQRNTFITQLAQQTASIPKQMLDWSDIFITLNEHVHTGKHIVFFDEISWMGSKDETFLGKLKIAWDEHLSKNPSLILILCGSVSTWIEENILSSTGYFGRISKRIDLEPFSLSEANEMLEAVGFRHSHYEKFKILSITGTIPWYLENIIGELDANKNIQQLCYKSGGLLVDEFNNIFHDLFEKKGDWYKTIINALVSGSKQFDQLCKDTSYANSGAMTNYLNELIKAGFIKRFKSWSITEHKKSNITYYRLSDNYLRYYLKYIGPKIEEIENHTFDYSLIENSPAYSSILGLQFENLILNNAITLIHELNIEVSNIANYGTFIQRKTTRQEGLQIDIMIQTKFNTLYIVEIKFSQNPVKKTVINEVKTKIKNLTKPKKTGCVPILIHINGVEDSVLNEDYFMKIICLSDLLTKPN